MQSVADWNDDAPAPGSTPGGERVIDPPEVHRLLEAGYELAPDAPVWAYLPAVWPPNYRAWVHDRMLRTGIIHTAEGSHEQVWDEGDYAEIDADYASLCRDANVPERPTGRLWLLKPPPGRTVQDVLDDILEEVTAAGAPFRTSPALTELTCRVLSQAWP